MRASNHVMVLGGFSDIKTGSQPKHEGLKGVTSMTVNEKYGLGESAESQAGSEIRNSSSDDSANYEEYGHAQPQL